MSILKDLDRLLENEVISPQTADRIRNFYQSKTENSGNRLFIVFGILGALLLGLGVILIIAHNWDELSRTTKSILAFLPLLVGQVLCGFTLVRKHENTAWREATSTFLVLAVGASISLISQIYNIPGDISSFLLTWIIASLPVIYVMRSSMASILVIVSSTWYAIETGYWTYPSEANVYYWLFLLLALPHYFLLIRKKPHGNFTVFHHWLISLSVIISLGSFEESNEELMFVAYFSLFGMFYLIGLKGFFAGQKNINNAYRLLGSLGMLVLLLMLSFDWFWKELRNEFPFDLASAEAFAAVTFTLFASWLFYDYMKKRPLSNMKPFAPMFLLFLFTFIIGCTTTGGVVLVNILLLTAGILTIQDGARKNHLGILNYGMLIVTSLVTCRFFDTELSFVLRGIIFVTVGAGFFATNLWMLKKRKAHG